MGFTQELDIMMEDVVGVLGDATQIVLFKPTSTPSANASTMTRSPSYGTGIVIHANEHPIRKDPLAAVQSKTAAVKIRTYDIRLADVTGGPPDETWRLGVGADATAETSIPIVRAEADANMMGMVIEAREGG